MTTTLLVVRHGETKWNVEGRMQGHLDSDLDTSGVEQADAVGRRLAGERIDGVISSDLGRTVATARGITAHTRHEIRTDARLRERHLGIFQGLTGTEAALRHAHDWRRFKERDPEHDLHGGETLRQFSARCVECVNDLAARQPRATLLVVTHGGVLDVLFRHTTGLPLEAPRTFTLLNASLNTFEITDGMWTLLHWGDIAHLGVRDAIDDV
ncbi:MAG: histidine phosphatase family protein [Burkholderiales bacterium]|nr:histidine phosphatase family protein [Burkholderiales bacterium]